MRGKKEVLFYQIRIFSFYIISFINIRKYGNLLIYARRSKEDDWGSRVKDR